MNRLLTLVGAVVAAAAAVLVIPGASGHAAQTSPRLLALLARQHVDHRPAQQRGIAQTGRKARAPTLPQATADGGARVPGLTGEPAGGTLQQPRPAKLPAKTQHRHHPRVRLVVGRRRQCLVARVVVVEVDVATKCPTVIVTELPFLAVALPRGL